MNEHPNRASGDGNGWWRAAFVVLCVAGGAAVLLPGHRDAVRSASAERSTVAIAQPAEAAVAPDPLAGIKVDWSRIEASPDPSPMSVAAYEQ